MVTIAQDPAADQVLSDDPFALLVGMLLDQQYPMEHAFEQGVVDREVRSGELSVHAAHPTGVFF